MVEAGSGLKLQEEQQMDGIRVKMQSRFQSGAYRESCSGVRIARGRFFGWLCGVPLG